MDSPTLTTKVPADDAASIITSAQARSDQEVGQCAYDLLHFDREMTPEKHVELCALMCTPKSFTRSSGSIHFSGGDPCSVDAGG